MTPGAERSLAQPTHYEFISFNTDVCIDPVQLAIFGFGEDIHKRQSMAEIIVVRSS